MVRPAAGEMKEELPRGSVHTGRISNAISIRGGGRSRPGVRWRRRESGWGRAHCMLMKWLFGVCVFGSDGAAAVRWGQHCRTAACKHQLLPCRRLAGLTPLPPHHHSSTNTKHAHTNAHGRTPRCNITLTWTYTRLICRYTQETHTHTQMHMDILNASLQTSRWTNTQTTAQNVPLTGINNKSSPTHMPAHRHKHIYTPSIHDHNRPGPRTHCTKAVNPSAAISCLSTDHHSTKFIHQSREKCPLCPVLYKSRVKVS